MSVQPRRPTRFWQRWRKLLRFNLMYLRQPPWDTGVTPPEVIEVVEGGVIPPGRAVDLGCGTGTNAIYLARRGFTVYGVDSALIAILKARRKARRAGVHVHFHVGAVTRLDFLPGPVDFALDIGCLHGLLAEDRPAYAAAVANAFRPGGHYLLYAWGWRGWAGIEPEEVKHLFGDRMQMVWMRTGEEGGAPATWYLMRGVDHSEMTAH